MIKRLLAFLILCSTAMATQFAGMVSTAFVYPVTLWDGSAVVTGATLTLSVQRVSDGDYWTGSAWQVSYTVVSGNMTEQTGNISLEGQYRYTLSSGAVSSTADTFLFSSKYTTSGGAVLYNRDTLQTYLPTTSAGIISDPAGTTTLLSRVSSARAGYLDNLSAGAVALASGVNLTQIDGQATSGNNATLHLKQLDVQNNAGTAINAISTGGEGNGIAVYGDGASYGLAINGGDFALAGLSVVGGASTNADSILLQPHGTGIPINPAVGGLTTAQVNTLASLFQGITVEVVSFVSSVGTISVTQNTDYPSGLIALSRTWTGEDISSGATVTFSAVPSVNGAVAINGSACTMTGGTTGALLTVNVPLTHTQTADLKVAPYTYEIKIVTGGGHIYRPFTGTMQVSRKVN